MSNSKPIKMKKLLFYFVMLFMGGPCFSQIIEQESLVDVKTTVHPTILGEFSVGSSDIQSHVNSRYRAIEEISTTSNGFYIDNSDQVKKKDRVELQLKAKKNTPVILRVASVDPTVTIIMGENHSKTYSVSTDLNKLTPLSFTTVEDNQSIVIEGDLIALDCKNINITTLDCTNAPRLQLLDCGENKLTNLDVTNCRSLKHLYVMNNKLEKITLGDLPVLEDLNASFNNLSFINIAKLPLLKNFSVDKNHIENLDFSNNLLLEKIYCKSNRIQILNVTKLLQLNELSAGENRITQLDLTMNPSLSLLDLKDNSIVDINLTKNTMLEDINLNTNNLKKLDVSHCLKLKELYCNTNVLTELDLSNNQMLEVLSCGDNKLSKIDVSDKKYLYSLALMFNELTEVKVDNCPNLLAAGFDHNKLTSLDLSDSKKISLMDVSFNMFSVNNTLEMVSSLPTRPESDPGILVYKNSSDYPDDKEGNEFDDMIYNEAYKKFWLVVDGEKSLLRLNNIERESTLMLYPTVSEQVIHIDGDYSFASIHGMDGSLVMNLFGEDFFYVDQFANGVYFFNAKSGDKFIQCKFVVKHK